MHQGKLLFLGVLFLLSPLAASQVYDSVSCTDPDNCDFSMNTDPGKLVITGYSTASTGNNCDWTFNVDVNGTQVASVKEGDSDSTVDDTQAIATTIDVNSGTHSINTYETHECGPNYVETQVSAFMASTISKNSKTVSCSDPDNCDLSMDTDDGNILLLAHSSANSGNNQDWSFNVDLNNSRIATSKEGDSDSSVYDTQFLTSIASVNAGVQDINTYENHEGGPSWRETQVSLFELREDVFRQGVYCSNPDNCDFSVSHDSEATFVAGHSSAKTSKNNEWTFGLNRDGTNIGEVKEGNSNDNVFDAQGINSIVEENNFNLDSYQSNEGSPSWRETQVVAVEIKNSSALSPICDREGSGGECISETSKNIDGKSFDVEREFQVKNTAFFETNSHNANINVTNSSSISGIFRGTFTLISNENVIRPGASLHPSNGNIQVIER